MKNKSSENVQNTQKSTADSMESADPMLVPPSQTEDVPWGETFSAPENFEWLSPKEGLRLLQELRVHQIELEMQNEELRRTQAKLQASQARYFDLYDVAPVGYVTIVEKGRITEVNLTAANLMGVERGALVEQHLTSFILPEDQDIFYRLRKSLLAKNLPQACELRFVRRDKTRFWARMDATVTYDAAGASRFRVAIIDITDRKRAEDERQKFQDQLFQARKMEAIGTLTAGIAHDFNNILQGINGFAQLLLMEKNLNDPEYEHIMWILKSGERAARLVRQLYLYSQKMEGEPRSIDLNQSVRKTIARLRYTMPKTIDVELVLDSQSWPITADPFQIEQILSNLSGNAADAMPGGGRLIISTENVILDNEYVDAHWNASLGNHTLLTVSDTGCGMKEETVVHIFDPFFTTKGIGKGLGLSLVYGIVKSIGGHIECESKTGLGTTFSIFLPAGQKDADVSIPE